jgi:RND family efflux transporter MFP subunit
MIPKKSSMAVLLLVTVLLAACGEEKAPEAKRPAGPPPTLVSVTQATARNVEVGEEVVGSVENVFDPRLAAEVAGRVTRVTADVGKRVRKGDVLAEIDAVDAEIQTRSDAAEVARLDTLLANQERIVRNQQQLFEKSFISQNALDDAIAQRSALQEQLKAARAKVEAGQSTLRKTRLLAPVDGEVEERMVGVGDYVKLGDPMFRLVSRQELRAHLPFPESAGSRLKVGQTVRLSSPLVPDRVVETVIRDIRPTITAANRALDVIVDFPSEGTFRGGGTVNAVVVTGTRPNAIMVPEQSVVLRPAGKVVYLVADGKAVQAVVQTGVKKDGFVEIVAGLKGGETIAVDGAGFLTNNANVALAQPRGGPGGKPGAKPPVADPPTAGDANNARKGAT